MPTCFAGEITDSEWAFLCRARSTLALRELWAAATASPNALALGMGEFVDRDHFAAKTPTQRDAAVKHFARSLHGIDGLVARPWIENRFVFAVPEVGARAVDAAWQALAERIGSGRDRIGGYWSAFDAALSVSDHCDRLSTAFRVAPSGLQPLPRENEQSMELKVPCSYSHHFLSSLVAKNRRESLDSVLREAVSLWLDAGRIG